MSSISSGWGLASFVLLIASLAASLFLFIFLCVCYYPGGRKRSDVIDIGELPKYDLGAPLKPDQQQYYQEQPTGDSSHYSRQTTGEGDQYYDQRRDPNFRETDTDELPVRRGVQMMEI